MFNSKSLALVLATGSTFFLSHPRHTLAFEAYATRSSRQGSKRSTANSTGGRAGRARSLSPARGGGRRSAAPSRSPPARDGSESRPVGGTAENDDSEQSDDEEREGDDGLRQSPRRRPRIEEVDHGDYTTQGDGRQQDTQNCGHQQHNQNGNGGGFFSRFNVTARPNFLRRRGSQNSTTAFDDGDFLCDEDVTTAFVDTHEQQFQKRILQVEETVAVGIRDYVSGEADSKCVVVGHDLRSVIGKLVEKNDQRFVLMVWTWGLFMPILTFIAGYQVALHEDVVEWTEANPGKLKYVYGSLLVVYLFAFIRFFVAFVIAKTTTNDEEMQLIAWLNGRIREMPASKIEHASRLLLSLTRSEDQIMSKKLVYETFAAMRVGRMSNEDFRKKYPESHKFFWQHFRAGQNAQKRDAEIDRIMRERGSVVNGQQQGFNSMCGQVSGFYPQNGNFVQQQMSLNNGTYPQGYAMQQQLEQGFRQPAPPGMPGMAGGMPIQAGGTWVQGPTGLVFVPGTG